jgi:hypothetical protein
VVLAASAFGIGGYIRGVTSGIKSSRFEPAPEPRSDEHHRDAH